MFKGYIYSAVKNSVSLAARTVGRNISLSLSIMNLFLPTSCPLSPDGSEGVMKNMSLFFVAAALSLSFSYSLRDLCHSRIEDVRMTGGSFSFVRREIAGEVGENR